MMNDEIKKIPFSSFIIHPLFSGERKMIIYNLKLKILDSSEI